MIEFLFEYAVRGKFPNNEESESRTPVFLDNFGTPCAVGHLLQRSGEKGRAIAREVDRAFHLSYVHDMDVHSGAGLALADWATAHGLRLAELAMIQPGYQKDPAALTCSASFSIAATAVLGAFGLALRAAQPATAYAAKMAPFLLWASVLLLVAGAATAVCLVRYRRCHRDWCDAAEAGAERGQNDPMEVFIE